MRPGEPGFRCLLATCGKCERCIGAVAAELHRPAAFLAAPLAVRLATADVLPYTSPERWPYERAGWLTAAGWAAVQK